MPARQAGCGIVERGGAACRRCDPPAREGGACGSEAVPAQQQGGGQALAGGEREPAAQGEIEAFDLAQHRRQRSAAQSLLHRPGDIPVAAGGEQQQVCWLETEVPPARPVEPAEGACPALADQHGEPFVPAPEPGEEGCEEGAGRRSVPRRRAGRLVQPARRQPAFRQGGVQGVETEPPGFHRPASRRVRNCRAALQQRDPPAQRGEAGRVLPGAYRQH